MMALSHFVVLSVILAVTVAEPVIYEQCKDESQDHCSVTEVRIAPCAPSKKKAVCILELGLNVSLSFDFTPKFSTSNLKTMVSYQMTPFGGMSSDDACPYTDCPSVSGTSQIFNYHLYIGQKLPVGTYAINWKVWNGDSDQQSCCFTTTIKLKKPKKN